MRKFGWWTVLVFSIAASAQAGRYLPSSADLLRRLYPLIWCATTSKLLPMKLPRGLS